MADSELEMDMVMLQEHGYITKEYVKKFKDEKAVHEELILLNRGKELARDAELNLSSAQMDSLKKKAEILTNLDKRAESLLHEYGHKWCENAYREMVKDFGIA